MRKKRKKKGKNEWKGKVEAGTVALTLEPILVEELIDGAVEANRAFAAGFRVELEIGAIADAQVRGDFDRLIQVLTNLISNACKHSPSEGTVTVAVERRGDQLAGQLAAHARPAAGDHGELAREILHDALPCPSLGRR